MTKLTPYNRSNISDNNVTLHEDSLVLKRRKDLRVGDILFFFVVDGAGPATALIEVLLMEVTSVRRDHNGRIEPHITALIPSKSYLDKSFVYESIGRVEYKPDSPLPYTMKTVAVKPDNFTRHGWCQLLNSNMEIVREVCLIGSGDITRGKLCHSCSSTCINLFYTPKILSYSKIHTRNDTDYMREHTHSNIPQANYANSETTDD